MGHRTLGEGERFGFAVVIPQNSGRLQTERVRLPECHARFRLRDGAFHVFLESVDAEGEVTYVTEGELRALHRKVTPSDAAPAAVYGPYHTFNRADSAPLVPGEVTVLEFELFPTSVRFRQDTRIQLSIAGADADTFERIPAQGDPVIQVHRAGSWIDLPVRE